MKTSDRFFIIQKTHQAENGKLRLAGQFIVDCTIEVVPSSNNRTDDQEPKFAIEMIRPFEVKWILPPKSAMSYGAIKQFAESMGYETVEHDDFSYPP